jgi:hypothetical protein
MKSGKKVEGTVIHEDDATIQIKGDDGVILRLNKNSIDADATSAANPATPAKEQTQSRPSPQNHEDSKSSLTGVNKTGNNRIFTNEDLKGMPEVSILGSSGMQEPTAGSEFQKGRKEGRGLNEAFWRTAAIRLRQRRAIAEERCHFIRNKPAVATDKAPECPLMQEAEKQIEDFREEARRKGVPPNWISNLDE